MLRKWKIQTETQLPKKEKKSPGPKFNDDTINFLK